MKKYPLFLLILLIVLTSCSSKQYYQSYTDQTNLNDNWLTQIQLDPGPWIKSADPWFYNGSPNQTELNSINAPASAAMTIMAVKVPSHYTRLDIQGNFQVQLVGMQDKNTLFILGPNDGARLVGVMYFDKTLYVHQTADACPRTVIVRIGVNKLDSLTYIGGNTLEGRLITSDHLVLTTGGGGNALLAGNINLTQVNAGGNGTLSVIGVRSPHLNIDVGDSANVNLAGMMDINNINHYGFGTINIIGALSHNLSINAFGGGTLNIAGNVVLKSIMAGNNSRVHIYWVKSPSVSIMQSGASFVGLAGVVDTLNVNTTDNAQFAGQYLHAKQAFVKTSGNSHANILPDNKLFASASDYSSIYYFGTPKNTSINAIQGGAIIPIHSPPPLIRKMPTPVAWNNFK